MASEVSELRERIEKNLNDESKPWAPILKTVEDLTGVNRTQFFWGLVVVTLLWLAFGYAGQLVCNFIGVLYPAYASIHAIESRDATDDTKWLTYWVVYASFSFVEIIADYFAGWFPFYWLIKCIFFVWLMIPTRLNGSLIVYKNIIKPYFLEYKTAVDDAIHAVQSTAADLVESKNK